MPTVNLLICPCRQLKSGFSEVNKKSTHGMGHSVKLRISRTAEATAHITATRCLCCNSQLLRQNESHMSNTAMAHLRPLMGA